MIGAPEEIRTPDPQLRRLLLYPAELQVQKWRKRWDLNPRVSHETASFQD